MHCVCDLSQNISHMKTSGDEMELFAAVNRKFSLIFAQKEHMLAFRTYDAVEVGYRHHNNLLSTVSLLNQSRYVYSCKTSRV